MDVIEFEKLGPRKIPEPRSKSPFKQLLIDVRGSLGLLDPTLSRVQLTRELVSEQVLYFARTRSADPSSSPGTDTEIG